MAIVINKQRGGGVAVTLSGTPKIGQQIQAKFPPNYIGTLQFTRTTKTEPITKTIINGASANAVNSLDYTVKSDDAPFLIGCDGSDWRVSSPLVGIGGRAPYLGPICSRNRLANNLSLATGLKQMMSWDFRDITSAVPAGQQIEIEYSNVFGINEIISAPGEVTCAVEFPQGVFTQFLCNGAAMGIMGESLARVFFYGSLAVNLPKGARIWVGTFVNWTGMYALYSTDGVNRFANWRDRNRAATTYSTVTTPDTTMTGVRSTTDVTGWGFHPVAIRSMTTEMTFGIVDDSQGRGSANAFPNTDDRGLVGMAERRLKDHGTINMSVPGDSYAETLVNNKLVKRAAILQGLPYIIDGLGANDGPLTWALLIGTYVPKMRSLFPGAKYIHSTYDNKNTSTDYFSTLAGQTPVANWVNQADINMKIRQKVSALIDFYFDDAITIESAPGASSSKISPATKTIAYPAAIAAGTTRLDKFPAGTFTVAANDLHRIVISGAGYQGADYGQSVLNQPSAEGRVYAYMRVISDTAIDLIEIGNPTVKAKATLTAVPEGATIIINAMDYMMDGAPHRSQFGEALVTGLFNPTDLEPA